MVLGAHGARNDLAKLRYVTNPGTRSPGSTPTPPTHAQPTAQQSHGEGHSGGRRGRANVTGCSSYWPGGPPNRQRGLKRLGRQRFSPRPEGLHHVDASLAAGRRAAPVARGQLRATLAAKPTAARQWSYGSVASHHNSPASTRTLRQASRWARQWAAPRATAWSGLPLIMIGR